MEHSFIPAAQPIQKSRTGVNPNPPPGEHRQEGVFPIPTSPKSEEIIH
jgi:hypothetical protein